MRGFGAGDRSKADPHPVSDDVRDRATADRDHPLRRFPTADAPVSPDLKSGRRRMPREPIPPERGL